MKKVLFVASVYGFIEGFEIENIKILLDLGYEVHTIANSFDYSNGKTYETIKLDKLGIIKHEMDSTRNPLTFKNILSIKKVKKLIKRERFSLIDTHTPMGGVIGRTAAVFSNIKPIIFYTAHGFHFYKGAPKKNWIIYYTIEKFLSRFTDLLITINREDYERAINKFHSKKVEFVPGVGIDTEKFQNMDISKEQKRQELGIKKEDIMLLSVGELNENKNHKIVVQALAGLHNRNIHYFIAGEGDLKRELVKLSHALNIGRQVHVLGFRNDVAELYRAADIFIFPSIREGLSVALMEAMASECLCIVSDIRGNSDLIENPDWRFLTNDEHKIITLLDKAINCSISVKKECICNNNQVLEKYTRIKVGEKMKKIYKCFDTGI